LASPGLFAMLGMLFFMYFLAHLIFCFSCILSLSFLLKLILEGAMFMHATEVISSVVINHYFENKNNCVDIDEKHEEREHEHGHLLVVYEELNLVSF
jgi:hypothetical protein